MISSLWPEPGFREFAQEATGLLRDHLHVRHFSKGSYLWHEGDDAGMLVSLKKGQVKVFRLLPSGRNVTLYILGPGDLFGFLPFLDGQAYPASALAIEDVEADVMGRGTLLQALRDEPELAAALIGLLGRRLRASFDLILSLSMSSARARVAQALLTIVPPRDPATGHRVIDLPVSAQEFAGAIGIVPETFSRVLTNLVQDGILERDGSGRYRVLDLDRLEQASDPGE
jgi:CRP-like cAMP-binding protein